jgi:chromosome segregation ATPase
VANVEVLASSHEEATVKAEELARLQHALNEAERANQALARHASASEVALLDAGASNALLEVEIAKVQDALAKAELDNAGQAIVINALREEVSEAAIDLDALSLDYNRLQSARQRIRNSLQRADNSLAEGDTSLASEFEVATVCVPLR